MSPSPRRNGPDVADLTRSILALRRLSLAEVSRQSRIRFPGNPRFRIPPNFYEGLRRASFSPSAHQLYTLSVVTGYRLVDWMSLFGFEFDDAVQFQASLPRYNTAELDARIYDPLALIPWFEEAQLPTLGSELTPMSRWLSGRVFRSIDSLASRPDATFRYLKLGIRDVYAFPDLLPGSIVRVNHRIPSGQLLEQDKISPILAIEDDRGMFCARLRLLKPGRVVLCSGQLPYAPVELELGCQARILGSVDLEIRQLESRETPEVRANRRRRSAPQAAQPTSRARRISEVLRSARLRSALPFREASERTREVARVLRDPAYFCSPATLSDLEAGDQLPRHLHKLISLSAVYALSLFDLTERAGLSLEQAGQEPMPASSKTATFRKRVGRDASRSPLLKALEDEFGEIPFFLRKALPEVLGLPNLSVRDLFWAGRTWGLLHPYLNGAVLLAVNRKSKTLVPSLSSPIWAQPLHVLELRNGQRLCASCCLEDKTLIVRPCTTVSGGLLRLRHGIDAEVLGKVVAIVRRVRAASA
jgi:hypothetical protein